MLRLRRLSPGIIVSTIINMFLAAMAIASMKATETRQLMTPLQVLSMLYH
jgi:hypothetical protein